MTFCSSRTLPGQSYSAKRLSVSEAMACIGRPDLRALRSMKYIASCPMSLRRSRSGGTRSGITLRR